MNQKLITLALFGAITLPIAAFADTPDEIVVTATRLPQALSKTLADTTLLNEQEIRSSGATDVATLLRSVAGVEVTQTGGLGSQSSIFMRGTNSNQVLVLIDGVRINSATAGTTAIEHIMLDNVERIEVVRGNVSSLYGSEAIGGVIQIFTKQGHGDPVVNASAGIGSHGLQKESAGFSGAVDNTSFSVNAGHVKTDGVSAMNSQLMPGANPNNNGYDNNTVDAQIKHAFNADHALSASVLSTRGNSSIDNAFGAPTDINNSVANLDKYSVAMDDQFNDTWHSQVQLAEGVDDNHSYTNSVLSSRFQTKSDQLAWQNALKISDTQKVNLGAEHLAQAVTSTTLFSLSSRSVNSVLAGYTGEYGAQQVQFNLRQDNYSDFGAANAGLLAYGISFADSWRATASISNAFKAPTFNDMYYPLSFGYQGNAHLKPERSQNQEIGLHYAANNHHVDAVYFDNRIRDLIAGNAAGTTMININQAQITGEELSYAGNFGNSHLQMHATFQNPHDTATGQTLLRRAKQFASIAASHDYAKFNVGTELRYSGARQDAYFNTNTFANTSVTLPAYTLLNLTSRYTIDQHFNVTARLDNLTNRNYAEVYGYNTLGRTLFVGLNYQQ
ncbi:MAG: TonB-dependent receptor [Gallionella sp.]